jgi:hypothetical protein
MQPHRGRPLFRQEVGPDRLDGMGLQPFQIIGLGEDVMAQGLRPEPPIGLLLDLEDDFKPLWHARPPSSIG